MPAETAAAPTAPRLLVEDLQVVLGRGSRAGTAVAGMHLRLAPGEIRALVGPSGCGKSTLAQAVLGLLPPDGRIVGGSVHLDGRRIDALPAASWRRLRGRELAWVPQDSFAALHPLRRVGVQLGETLRLVAGLARHAALEQAAEILAQLGFVQPRSLLAAYPHELSGGMAQRVAVALALASAPRCLLADEPTASLDGACAGRVLDLLHARARDDGMGVLLITHDPVAIRRADGSTRMAAGAPAPRRCDRPARSAQPRPGARVPAAARPLLHLDRLCVDRVVRDGPLGMRRHRRRILHEISLSVGRAEAVAVTGASGSGKSTLAAVVAGLLSPSAGRITFDGNGAAPRGAVQLLFQDHAASLDPCWTVAALLAEPLVAHGLATDRRTREMLTAALLRQVGLDHRVALARPGGLSGGEKQRVALARALAARPRLLVLDEPTAALDTATRDEIVELLAGLRAAGDLSLLLLSHDPDVVAALADRVFVLLDGRLAPAAPIPLPAPPARVRWPVRA